MRKWTNGLRRFQEEFAAVVRIISSLLVLFLIILLPSIAANKQYVYRTNTPSAYSAKLGVMAVPVIVMIANARHNGLYIQTAPSLELGKKMGLYEGMVLLTMDGHQMNSVPAADDWVSRRGEGSVQFTYVYVVKGQPTIRYGKSDYASSRSNPSQISIQSQQVSVDDLESYSFTLVNGSRTRDGLSQLSQDSALARQARKYAEYMAQNAQAYDVYGSRNPHTDLQGRSAADRAHEAGISYFQSENIGRGTRGFGQTDRGTIGEIHKQMMAEPAGQANHRGSIMDPQARRLGVGVARTNNRIFMAQEFGN